MNRCARAVAASALLLAQLHGAAVAQAVSCERLRAEVEAKIRGNGVTEFAVAVVAAASQVQGQTVGTCERGTRKLVYVKGGAAGADKGPPSPAAAPDAAAPARPKPPPVVTECADGRVITSGNCKSR